MYNNSFASQTAMIKNFKKSSTIVNQVCYLNEAHDLPKLTFIEVFHCVYFPIGS